MNSLRKKIVGLVVASLVVALGIYSVLLYANFKKIIVANQEEHLSRLAIASCREMAQWFEAKKTEMLTLADSVSLAGNNKSIIVRRLKLHATTNPQYEMLFYADKQGNAFTSSDFQANIHDRPYFQQALLTAAPVVSDPVVSRQSQRPIVVIAAPVKDGNRVTGVIGCTIPLSIFSQLTSHIKPSATGYAFVIQEDGTTIIHPDTRLAMKHNILKDPQIDPSLLAAVSNMVRRQAGIAKYAYENVDKYLAYAPIPGSNWALAINAPVGEVLQQLSPVNRLIVITPIFVVVLASALISFLVIVLILRPLSALRNVMARVEAGDLDVRSDFNARDEIGQLTNSFNRMVQTLRQGAEKLQQSEEKYRTVFETTGTASVVLENDGTISLANAEFVQLSGYSRDEIENRKTWMEFVVKEDLEYMAAQHALRRKEQNATLRHYEFRFVRRSGDIRNIYLNVNMVPGTAKSIASLLDITERKRAAEALRESEERYRGLAEESFAGVYVVQNGHFVYINDNAASFAGYRRDELDGRRSDSIIHPDDRDKIKLKVRSMLKAKDSSSHEFRIITKDRQIRWIMETIASIRFNGKPAILGNSMDITEHKRAEEALQNALASLQAVRDLEKGILQSVPHGLFGVEQRSIFFANDAMKAVFGWEPEELIGKSTRIIFRTDEEWSEYGALLYSQLEKEPSTVFEWDKPFVRKDGSEFFCRMSVSRIGAELGDSRRIVATFEDITERKKAEEAVRESQRRMADIIEFLPDATLVIDKGGRVIAWNRAMESMTGIKKEDMLGKGNYEYSLPFYGDRRPILIDLALHPDKAKEKQYTAIQRVGDILFGESFTPNIPPGDIHLSATASVLRDSQGNIIAAIECIRDNTERKRLEERLNRAEKMEGLGRLAGGVAHDLNNVLGVLVGYSELLAEKLSEDNPLRRYAVNIQQSSLRGAAIIQDLLTLARRGVTVSEVVDLNKVIFDYLRTPEFEALKSHHPKVKVWTELEEELLNIKGSPVHLSKTIMNLVSNAAEAISDLGDVTISSENRYLDQPIRGYDNMQEGDYVVLKVSDSGSGIPSHDIGKIFEPFYTKKVMGRSGTGLGLAVVWGTVKDHNGYIDVQSEEGKGTTFTIYFPVTREEITKAKEAVSQSIYMGKGESVLVVDDVKEQREIAVNILGRLGYQVEAISSGEEAIDYLKNKKVDLVMLDMIMDPGIDGLETYRRIIKINPEQKAIIVSGFSETDRVKEAQKIGAGAFVQKPYIMEKVGLALRRELDNRK